MQRGYITIREVQILSTGFKKMEIKFCLKSSKCINHYIMCSFCKNYDEYREFGKTYIESQKISSSGETGKHTAFKLLRD